MDSKAYAKEHKQAFIAKVVKGKAILLFWMVLSEPIKMWL